MQFNKQLKDIKTYVGGKPIEEVMRDFGLDEKDIIKLASNENPFGTSPKAIQALQENAHIASIYPNDDMTDIKNALANKYNVTPKNIIMGAGSDQVIFFAINAKANKYKKILTARTTFAMYEIYAKQIGVKVLKTPSHQHNLDEFLNIYKKEKDIGIIFLCLPNNPLGECISKDEVFKFLEKIDDNTLVIIDGAYQDFASYKDEKMKIDPKELIETFQNTLFLATFSKSYGLGGMRVGYGIANTQILEVLYKLRSPFNVTTLSLKAAVAALSDDKFVSKTIQNNFKEMEKYENFARENQIDFINSYTNFITFIFNNSRDSKKLSQLLLKKGIIVRDLTSYKVNGLRVTIGTEEQNSIFLKEFKKLI